LNNNNNINNNNNRFCIVLSLCYTIHRLRPIYGDVYIEW